MAFEDEVRQLLPTDLNHADNINEVSRDLYNVMGRRFSNPNMLINGNFTNAVNQRGKSEYTISGQYTIDRWKLISNGKVSISSDGLAVEATESSGGYIDIVQILENNITEGTKVTLSWCDENGIYLATGEVPDKPSEGASFFATAYGTGASSNTYMRCSLSYINNMSVELVCSANNIIKWVKLEYGETSTPFVPRLYAEELALCQRYYFNANISPRLTPYVMWARGTTELYGSIVFPVSMRTIPKLVNVTARSNSNGQFYKLTGFTSHLSPLGTGCLFDIASEIPGAIADGISYMVEFEADAEVY
jgi:hypothetical protein